MDSANGGLKLELSNAKLKTISDSQFMLWDELIKGGIQLFVIKA